MEGDRRLLRNGRLDYKSQRIDEALLEDLRALVRLAIREDLEESWDLTTVALVPPDHRGSARLIARPGGVAAGIDLIPHIIDELDAEIECVQFVRDGERFEPGAVVAELKGKTRDLLTCERTILNFTCRLCGVATGTKRFVDQIAGSKCRLYDTRKTTPGWRRLEKYATRCGGAFNHRTGLYDAILIKDNHLAARGSDSGQELSAALAVVEARKFVESLDVASTTSILIEIEVTTMRQLREAFTAKPDIILLDNMSLQDLRTCVELRDREAPNIELEASGGVRLDTIAAIARTGVDRISVGALTHSAVQLDLGLDWSL